MADWKPDRYALFADLRLRPALDLLGAVPELPEGAVVDLGCGAGAVAAALRARFPGRALVGVDSSPKMLAQAEGAYDSLTEARIEDWEPAAPPALIFANAALNWVEDHAAVLTRLTGLLPSAGVLAVQVPRQSARPSHALWRSLSTELFPGRFDWSDWVSEVAEPAFYARLLERLGAARVWETQYYQRLEPCSDAHPVRLFTRATYGRRVLDKLSEAEQTRIEAAYDLSVAETYPLEADGSVWFPFRRLFFVVQKS